MSGGTKQAWVSSGSDPRPGPLVLLRTNLLASWSGGDGGVARASAIREIGTIPVGIGSALVLAGKSVPTTWIPGPTGGMLVRWLEAATEDAALAAAASAGDATWTPTGCRFRTRAGDHLLFHASLPGVQAVQAAKENIPVKLSTGVYDVTSAMLGDHPTSVFVYRLTWRPEKTR